MPFQMITANVKTLDLKDKRFKTLTRSEYKNIFGVEPPTRVPGQPNLKTWFPCDAEGKLIPKDQFKSCLIRRPIFGASGPERDEHGRPIIEVTFLTVGEAYRANFETDQSVTDGLFFEVLDPPIIEPPAYADLLPYWFGGQFGWADVRTLVQTTEEEKLAEDTFEKTVLDTLKSHTDLLNFLCSKAAK